jgi:hypothetical protein
MDFNPSTWMNMSIDEGFIWMNVIFAWMNFIYDWKINKLLDEIHQ